jgi:hypothetical protein
VISGITLGAVTSSAAFKGGMSAPVMQAVIPDTIDKERDSEALLDIRGSHMLYGADAFLSHGRDTVRASTVAWLGEERIIADFPFDELYAGAWDLSIVSGDGQTSTFAGALAVVSVYVSASVTAGRDDLLVQWALKTAEGVRGSLLFRSADGGPYAPVADTLRSSTGDFSFRDNTVDPHVSYSYKIATYLTNGGEEIYVLTGPFDIPKLPFIVDQNYPNPFGTETTLSFFVPSSMAVSIDIYDVSGRLVERFGERSYGRGTHTRPWQPAERGTRAGVYFCVFRTPGMTKVIKLVYSP